MKHIVGLIGIVAVVMLFTGCTGSNPNVIDCGSDIQCFSQAAETCSPAKVTMAESTMTMYMEILGGTMEACQIYYEFDMGQLGKTDMTCTIPVTEQIDMNNLEELCAVCSGSMLQGVC